jgi:hypothetical protein
MNHNESHHTAMLNHRPTALAALLRPVLGAGVVIVTLLATPALALPFDPVPSAFQRWLNARQNWPDAKRVTFSQLGQCSDQSAAHSPYRLPVFTCLSGQVTLQSATGTQVCGLTRVSYFPGNQRVRYWTSRCQ